LGQFAVANRQPILDSKYEYDNWPTPDNQPLVCKDSKSGCVNVIGTAGHPVLTLGMDLGLGSRLDDVRFSLSLNSCTACHLSETRTASLQIGPRSKGHASQLSGFLTGQPDCKMSDSPSGRKDTSDPIPYCPVSTHNSPDPPGNCAGVTIAPRKFNDLLRRHMYLYTVQHMSKDATKDEWTAALAKFIAYQVD
jgi:hypothetical protein